MFYAFNFALICNTFFLALIQVAIKGNCETIIHNITCTLDLHLDWIVLQLYVANAFCSMLRRVIFQELYAIGETSYNSSHLFVHSMHFESPMFYSHYSYENDGIVIPSAIKVIPWEGHYLY